MSKIPLKESVKRGVYEPGIRKLCKEGTILAVFSCAIVQERDYQEMCFCSCWNDKNKNQNFWFQ